jgi:hypothetical protein
MLKSDVIRDSHLLAKVILQNRRGDILIVTVFEASEYFNFFYEFSAPKARSPRRRWKFRASAPVYPSLSLENFIALRSDKIVSMRFPRGRKAFDRLLRQIANQFNPATYTPPKYDAAKCQLVRKKNKRAFKRS